MKELLCASYVVRAELGGRKAELPLNLTAQAGENIFLHGNSIKRRQHFEVLCGLRKAEMGDISIDGQMLSTMSATEKAVFRRDTIGGIPEGGGLIPELPMMEQIVLPMVLAGENTESIRSRLQEMVSDQIPAHSLYNLPGRVPVRKAALAAILRAMIRKPQIIVINGFFDELDEVDADTMWDTVQALRVEGSVLLYLSGSPAPTQIQWTQTVKL